MVVPEGPIDLTTKEDTPNDPEPTVETSYHKDAEKILVEYSSIRIPYERAVGSFRGAQKEVDL